jgi:hypothetical protein
MGEYAKLMGTGEEVKIGTCENMYYLRFDQRHQVWPIPNSLNPGDAETMKSIRFRFPWPDEDNNGPGDFNDPFRKLALQVPSPPEVEHGIVQFVASSEGYNVCLPCPEGPDADHGLKVHRNGFAGPTFLVQQAVRNGRLVAIMECVCGRRYNLPTIEDAEPFIAHLLDQAERYTRSDDNSRAQFLIEVAKRLREGYNLEVN